MTEARTESKGPLQGIRIIDLSMMLAGPSGSMLMGDLGAEIIKVEPIQGDETRDSPPYYYGDSSAYFWSINRNKKSVSIDLKSPEGKQVLYDLVKKCDVVYDNYRPGVLERLQIDYENLKRFNPQIICCSTSTFGYNGPYRDRPGYDLIVQAMSGGMSITGEPGGSPVRAVEAGYRRPVSAASRVALFLSFAEPGCRGSIRFYVNYLQSNGARFFII